MKKTLLFVMIVIFTVLGYSQTIQTSNGTVTQSSIPISSNYGYTYSQQIVTNAEIVSELGATFGQITKIRWNWNGYGYGVFNSSTDWKIYLGHTPNSSFSSNTDWVPLTSLTLVFDSVITPPTSAGWFEVTLQTPFTYNGTDNLVIAVDENTEYYSSAAFFMSIEATPSYRGIYCNNNTTNPNPASPPLGTRTSTIPNLQLHFLETCPTPNTPFATGITDSSMVVNWLPNGVESLWNFSYKDISSSTWTTVTGLTAPLYALTNLLPNTTYQVRVQADCIGDDISGYTQTTTFTTACGAVSSIPWTDYFDTYGTGTGVFPTCWYRLTSYLTYPEVSSVNSSSPGSLYFYAPNAGNYNIAVTPRFDSSIPINSLKVEFKYKTTNYSDTIYVGVMSDPLNASTFEQVAAIGSSTLYTWIDKEVFLNSYSGTGQYIAFKVLRATSAVIVYVDNLNVKLSPTCPRPIALAPSNVTPTSVALSWIENGSANSWNIAYKLSSESTWTEIPISTNPFTISSLSPNSTYQFKIQSNCGSEQSVWTDSITCTTLCQPIIQLPWIDGFESIVANNTLPSCWVASNLGTYTYTQIANNSQYNRVARSGTKAANFRRLCNDRFFSPSFDLTAGVTYQFSFWYITDGLSGWSTLRSGVYSNQNATSLIQNLTTISGAINTTYQEHISTFTPTTDGVYYFGIYCQSTSAPQYLTIDDISVEVAPSCIRPTAISFSNVSYTTASASWTPSPTAVSYEVVYGLSGIDPLTATPIAVNGTSCNMTGLTPSSLHHFYVRSVCSNGDRSDWSFLNSFNTKLLASIPYLERFEDQNVPIGYYTNGWNIGSTRGVTGNPANNIYKNLTLGSFTGYFNTIDIGPISNNMELSFEYKFSLKASPYNVVPVNSGNFIVAISTNSGSTYINVDTVFNNGLAGYQTYTFDLSSYNTQIVKIQITANRTSGDFDLGFDNIYLGPEIICPNPIALTASMTTSTSTNLSWTETGAATAWEIEYGVTGLTHGSGIVEIANNQPYLMSGLLPSTTYDFYVRAICGIGDTSLWSEKQTTTTGCAPLSLPFSETFNGSIFPDCWSQTYSGALTSNRWSVNVYNEAGGLPNEMECVWQNAIGVSRLISPAIDFTGVTNATLTFKHYYDDDDDGVTMKIQTSSDLITWTDQPFSITSGNGSVGPITATVPLTLSSDICYIAWVVDGDHYSFGYWDIDDISIDSGAVVTYTITATCDPHGTITPSGIITVNAGANQTFTFTPDVGFVLFDVYVDGVPVSPLPTTYTFTNVSANHTIHCALVFDGIEENELAQLVELFPNPTASSIELRLKSEQLHVTECRIYDMYGKLMKVLPINTVTTTIDVTDFAAGVYFVRIESERGPISKKFVKK